VVIDSDAEAEAAANRASQLESENSVGDIDFSLPDTGSEASEDNGDNIE
jgi:DNA-directed RNA polymerase subunit beta'